MCLLQERMNKIDGYSRLFKVLRSLGNPERNMLEALVSMVVEDRTCSREEKKLKVIDCKYKIIFSYICFRILLFYYFNQSSIRQQTVVINFAGK